MNKYRVIITNQNGKEVFNHAYDIPSTGDSVITLLLETQEFLHDVEQMPEDIMDPTLDWNIYFESPINFMDKANFISSLRKALIDSNFDMERLSKTIHELLDEIGIHTPNNKLDNDLKKYLIKFMEYSL